MGIRRRNLMGQMPITANVTIENVKGSWGESSKTMSGYLVYESKGSYNVNSGYDLAKVTFSGYPSFNFIYGSNAESSYDYMMISPLDYSYAQNWTGSSYTGYLLSTSGKQSSSAPNLSYTFTNDGGEHFFYVLYRKDGSVNSGADRGYIAFRQSNYLEVSNTQTSISCLSQNITYTITSDMLWNVNTSDSWITLSTNNGSGSSQVTATVTLNEGTSRTGYITFTSKNKTVTCVITQQEYAINVPTSVSISYNKPYTIELNSPLPISVVSDSEWLSYEIVQSNSLYNLVLTALIESESGEECEIAITSGSITKNITVKLRSSLQYISDDLIFYAPMSEGDLTDHVTQIPMQLTGYGSLEWDSEMQIYKITTSNTVTDTVLSFYSDRKWKDYINDDYTICIKACRFQNNYGTANKCRIISCGPSGDYTDEWSTYGLGMPTNMFQVGGGSIEGNTVIGSNFNQIKSIVTTFHYTGNSNFIQSNHGPFYELQRTTYIDGTKSNIGSVGAGKFTQYSDLVNSGLNIGLTGHANFKKCSFGIKEIRIYNRLLTPEEIMQYNNGTL